MLHMQILKRIKDPGRCETVGTSDDPLVQAMHNKLKSELEPYMNENRNDRALYKLKQGPRITSCDDSGIDVNPVDVESALTEFNRLRDMGEI